jgi:hypothetical protein
MTGWGVCSLTASGAERAERTLLLDSGSVGGSHSPRPTYPKGDAALAVRRTKFQIGGLSKLPLSNVHMANGSVGSF